MSEKNGNMDFSDVEARRSIGTRRRMTVARRAYYFFGMPVVRALFRLAGSTYRVHKIIGSEIADRIIDDKDSIYAPCYWHQHHILCSNLLRGWLKRGFRACFLVSASVDGEVPARIARSWGAQVIRGSANRTGALALRDMQQMMKKGYSIVTTADGPNGPKYEFKAGAVLMARIGDVPMVPIACAAERAWYLKRWDDFMIPKPFSRIVMAIGKPISIPKNAPLDDIEKYRLEMQYAINALMAESKLVLRQGDICGFSEL